MPSGRVDAAEVGKSKLRGWQLVAYPHVFAPGVHIKYGLRQVVYLTIIGFGGLACLRSRSVDHIELVSLPMHVK
jgi:hypothetical protein